MPCYYRTGEDQWGFTFEDLYGDGGASDEISAKEYRNRLLGQTALVTGANSGVGYETSLALARLGVKVTMACRNPSKCEAAAKTIREDEGVDTGTDVVTMTVDTSSLKSVQKFCQDFLSQTDDGEGAPLPLDMLFLNAGIGFINKRDGKPLELTEDGIEKTFATNVVGHHLMYRLLEPSIRRSDELRTTPARIVHTSSAASYEQLHPYKVPTDLETLNGDPPLGNMGPYSQSKLAQILWSKELTDQLDAEAIDNNSSDINPNSIVYANAAHPGAVATNIWYSKEFEKIPNTIIKYIEKSMWTSEEGALTLLYLGTAVEDLQNKKIRGQYFHPQAIWMKDHRNAKDDDPETKILQKKLWKFLDELVTEFL